jgi:integrase
MKTDYCEKDFFLMILGTLTRENRLALLTSLYTGLRIDDVLSLKTESIKKQRFTVREKKTGKNRRIYIGDDLQTDLLKIAGDIYVFENRLDKKRHRTRQAVWKDLNRACDCFRVSKTITIAPHSARKIYSVDVYRKSHNLEKVKELLNHSNEAVTVLYALADELTKRQHTNKQLQTVERL